MSDALRNAIGDTRGGIFDKANDMLNTVRQVNNYTKWQQNIGQFAPSRLSDPLLDTLWRGSLVASNPAGGVGAVAMQKMAESPAMYRTLDKILGTTGNALTNLGNISVQSNPLRDYFLSRLGASMATQETPSGGDISNIDYVANTLQQPIDTSDADRRAFALALLQKGVKPSDVRTITDLVLGKEPQFTEKQATARSGIRLIDEAMNAVQSGELNRGTLLNIASPITLGKARAYESLLDNIRSIIQNLRSGQQITAREERMFKRMMPNLLDSKDVQLKKLKLLRDNLLEVASRKAVIPTNLR